MCCSTSRGSPCDTPVQAVPAVSQPQDATVTPPPLLWMDHHVGRATQQRHVSHLEEPASNQGEE